MVELKKHKIIS